MEFLLPGLIFGYAAARGKFCLNSGFADAANKDFRKVNILIFAALVQTALMPVYLHAGLTPFTFSFSLLAVALGAFVFGMLMPFAGGCTAGIVFKAGEGSLGAAIATGGFFLAMGVAYLTPAKSLIDQASAIVPVNLPVATIEARYIAAVSAFAILLYLITRVKNTKADGALWSWKRTAVVISFALTLHALLSGLRANTIGAFFIPGFIDLWSLKPSPDMFFLLAVPAGAALTLIGAKTPVWQKIPLRMAFVRLFGGFGLGLAAAFAGGCSVGYSLALLPALSLHGPVALVAIFLGRAVSRR
jgi:uncharacterized membrane protein YedE/YeeE